MAIRQVRPVPYLFRDHPTLVRKIFHRIDEGFWITPGSKLVMAAFSGQKRPATADARSVEGAAVVLLPRAIVIVATPDGPLQQIIFQHAIYHFDRVSQARAVAGMDTQSHRHKKLHP